jgi:invasion protein IalB
MQTCLLIGRLMTCTLRHGTQSQALAQQPRARRIGSFCLSAPRWCSLAVILVLATFAAGTASRPALAEEGTVKAQHGDWQVVCKPPPAGAKGEVCALVQSVSAEDRQNVGLTIYFQKFTNGSRVLRVFAPLGILLPTGIGLKIDNADVGHAPFLRCQSFACYAQVVADDTLIGKFKNGKTAMFVIFQSEEAGIGIPVSLNGFSQAIEALK